MNLCPGKVQILTCCPAKKLKTTAKSLKRLGDKHTWKQQPPVRGQPAAAFCDGIYHNLWCLAHSDPIKDVE